MNKKNYFVALKLEDHSAAKDEFFRLVKESYQSSVQLSEYVIIIQTDSTSTALIDDLYRLAPEVNEECHKQPLSLFSEGDYTPMPLGSNFDLGEIFICEISDEPLSTVDEAKQNAIDYLFEKKRFVVKYPVDTANAKFWQPYPEDISSFDERVTHGVFGLL